MATPCAHLVKVLPCSLKGHAARKSEGIEPTLQKELVLAAGPIVYLRNSIADILATHARPCLMAVSADGLTDTAIMGI